MEFKVRDIGEKVEKSKAEIEEGLIKKAEEQNTNKDDEEKKKAEDEKLKEQADQEARRLQVIDNLQEEDVLTFIEKKYNKPFKTVAELLEPKTASEPLAPEVEAYAKFHKETGRGVEDFVRLSKDFEKMPADDLLREYFRSTEEGLDGEDIEGLIQKFAFDPETDEEGVVKERRLAKKQAISKAKKFFNQQKETYKKPLESRQVTVTPEDLENVKTYKELVKKAKDQQDEDGKKRSWFHKKTEEVFGKEFKGFEFAVKSGTKEAPVEKKFTFTPADVAELKKSNATPLNFINKFLDEQGLMKDAAGYHRALSIAMNPERFAQFFYEQGIADATEDVLKKQKNIVMSERRTPEVIKKEGMTIKSITPDSGHGLKIKSHKK